MNFEILGAAVVFVFCALLLKNLGFRGASAFCALGIALMAIQIISLISSPLSAIISLIKDSIAQEIVETALKILGIGYIFGITSDVCRELGEANAAKCLEIAGRVEIAAIILPFLVEIMEMGASLI